MHDAGDCNVMFTGVGVGTEVFFGNARPAVAAAVAPTEQQLQVVHDACNLECNAARAFPPPPDASPVPTFRGSKEGLGGCVKEAGRSLRNPTTTLGDQAYTPPPSGQGRQSTP